MYSTLLQVELSQDYPNSYEESLWQAWIKSLLLSKEAQNYEYAVIKGNSELRVYFYQRKALRNTKDLHQYTTAEDWKKRWLTNNVPVEVMP